jgi:branched-chain amino acid transport system permease protein
LLGVVVGSLLLIVMTNVFSSYANLSTGLFGLLLLVVMMAAPSGIVGTLTQLIGKRKKTPRATSAAAIKESHV